MNDNDYIKKAVELADGFEIADTWIWHINGTPHRFPAVNEPPQYLKDALAAQLVRQVDAIYAQRDQDHFDFEHPAFGSLSTGAAVVYPGDQFEQEAWIASDDDRTMNTIKAIVDSGVLVATEQGE